MRLRQSVKTLLNYFGSPSLHKQCPSDNHNGLLQIIHSGSDQRMGLGQCLLKAVLLSVNVLRQLPPFNSCPLLSVLCSKQTWLSENWSQNHQGQAKGISSLLRTWVRIPKTGLASRNLLWDDHRVGGRMPLFSVLRAELMVLCFAVAFQGRNEDKG